MARRRPSYDVNDPRIVVTFIDDTYNNAVRVHKTPNGGDCFDLVSFAQAEHLKARYRACPNHYRVNDNPDDE